MYRIIASLAFLCPLLTACSPSAPPEIAAEQRAVLDDAKAAAAKLEQAANQINQDITEQTADEQ